MSINSAGCEIKSRRLISSPQRLIGVWWNKMRFNIQELLTFVRAPHLRLVLPNLRDLGSGETPVATDLAGNWVEWMCQESIGGVYPTIERRAPPMIESQANIR